VVTRMAASALLLVTLVAAPAVGNPGQAEQGTSPPEQAPAPVADVFQDAADETAPTEALPPAVATGPVSPDVSARVFGASAGLIFNAVRADSTDDFEVVLARLSEALEASPDPVRRQQAAGWRVFRVAEPGPNGSVLYVFVLDPVVPGADYGVARVLAEAFPDEAGALYALYSGAFADGQTLVNLEPVEAIDGDGEVMPLSTPQPQR
jgi:hypothetical protein